MLDSARPAVRGDGPTTAAEALHEVTLELFATDDQSKIAGLLLQSAGRLLAVRTTSIWVPGEGTYECRGAIGDGSDRLTGRRVAASELADAVALADEAAFAQRRRRRGRKVRRAARVSRPFGEDGGFTDAEQELLRHLTDAAGAAMSKAKRLAASMRARRATARATSPCSRT